MRQEKLIALLREKDEQGMRALLAEYGPLMRYVAAPILPDGRDAEECVSEAAMRVWNGIDRYDPARGGWVAWVTAVTRNTALNLARKAGRSDADALPEDAPAPGPSPEESVLQSERQAALRRAVAALPEAEQVLFYRKYYYRQSTTQIARETGLTERAVEGRLYRLRMRLRDSLGGERDG